MRQGQHRHHTQSETCFFQIQHNFLHTNISGPCFQTLERQMWHCIADIYCSQNFYLWLGLGTPMLKIREQDFRLIFKKSAKDRKSQIHILVSSILPMKRTKKKIDLRTLRSKSTINCFRDFLNFMVTVKVTFELEFSLVTSPFFLNKHFLLFYQNLQKKIMTSTLAFAVWIHT